MMTAMPLLIYIVLHIGGNPTVLDGRLVTG